MERFDRGSCIILLIRPRCAKDFEGIWNFTWWDILSAKETQTQMVKGKKGSAVEIEIRITEMERVQRPATNKWNFRGGKKIISWLEKLKRRHSWIKTTKQSSSPSPINFIELSENQFYYSSFLIIPPILSFD